MQEEGRKRGGRRATGLQTAAVGGRGTDVDEKKRKKRITHRVRRALQDWDEKKKKEKRAALLNLLWIQIMAHIKESPSPL